MNQPRSANLEHQKLGTIGITLGDTAGVGPEVATLALASGQLDPDFEYRIVGNAPSGVVAGHPTPATARAAWDALEEAARGALSGELSAVVTGPVCKLGLYQLGFPFAGQTEFFAARCEVADFAMLLTGGALTVALLTTHLPLAQAVGSLSITEIVRVGTLLAKFLRLRSPRAPLRIAVAGLNPHAGEGGRLGTGGNRYHCSRRRPTAKLPRRARDHVRRPGFTRHRVLPGHGRRVGRDPLHVPRPRLDPAQAARLP